MREIAERGIASTRGLPTGTSVDLWLIGISFLVCLLAFRVWVCSCISIRVSPSAVYTDDTQVCSMSIYKYTGRTVGDTYPLVD